MATDVLETLGGRTRDLRAARGWTLRDLAERSGVSVRFLVAVESGRGNISIRLLADLAGAFGITPSDLLRESDTARQPHVLALLGLRGAGKTTIGRSLARRLHVRFVELDRRIEKTADLSLSELFSLYGAEHYRRLRREAPAHQLPGARTLGPGARRG